MKPFRIFMILMLVASLIACKEKKDSGVPNDAINPDAMNNPASATPGSGKDKVPVLQFDEDTHDFGRITEGEKIQYAFKFKNVGNGDLVIRSANGSCGCTVPEWPKEPIPPGGTGLLRVTFDSGGKHGMQNKTVTIISNTIPNTKVLTITGEVANADGTVSPNTDDPHRGEHSEH